MDIEKVKWMFALRASDSGIKKSIILFIRSARQEHVENPKQSRTRDFPHLPPNQTLPLSRRRRLLLLHSPEALQRFLRQDLLQRDDGAERSDATRRQRQEICPVAMDPPSMLRVFAINDSVSEVEREREKRPINLLGARQETVENPKQIRARNFPQLPTYQTLPLPRRRRLLLLHSPEALLHFLRQDLLQRDDGAERSDAMRRRRREICPMAMDPPSMVRVFAADESV
ncbi:uncharacterized protein G2W53_007853 [Senna tora]|uniref:Uncharacterized protein n=1 Tax=Senna tora TaxID=362788 RepID=A0A835CFA3_9FABA|nr:uncharacterized protein G2W53_007853 [Senna tora]